MPDEEWIEALEDGRKVKLICQELPEDGAFIIAQIGGSEVVYLRSRNSWFPSIQVMRARGRLRQIERRILFLISISSRKFLPVRSMGGTQRKARWDELPD